MPIEFEDRSREAEYTHNAVSNAFVDIVYDHVFISPTDLELTLKYELPFADSVDKYKGNKEHLKECVTDSAKVFINDGVKNVILRYYIDLMNQKIYFGSLEIGK